MKLKAEQIFPNGIQLKEDKTKTLVNLLVKYIEHANKNDIMPDKKNMSEVLGIGIGTVQNAYRILEDKGLVVSKQRIGTIISSEQAKKQTSKRDICMKTISDYMQKNNIDNIENLPSSRQLSKMFNIPLNTINSAINYLKTGMTVKVQKSMTLAEKISKEIEQYIEQNCKIGDNLPSINTLTKILNVSFKTVHEAEKILTNKRIITSYRGQHGTVILKMPKDKIKTRKEDLIFAPAHEAAFYYYEKIQTQIKKLIINNNLEIGSKLPTMRQLSSMLDANVNTIRRALKALAEDGYVALEKGRYGGTFVTNIPDEQSYKWIALNSQYIDDLN